MANKSLKLAVLGATGPSGQQFVRQALEEGHHVTALVRRPEALDELKHPNLKIKKCATVFRREAMEPHFVGQDAVISCLGHSPFPKFQLPFGKGTSFLVDSAKAIIPAMRMAKVNRLVTLSSWYLDTKAKDIPFSVRWRIWFIFGKLIDDHDVMDKYIRHECPDINYTLVRLPVLLDGPVSDKQIKVVDDGAMYVPETSWITRADTARFVLSCLGTDRWDKKCPAIATD